MMRARVSSKLFRATILSIAVPFIFLLHCRNLAAQTAEFTQNAKNSNSVSFEVPLGSYPGRGISLPITLRYSSQRLWRIGFINSVYPTSPHVPRSVAEAIYAE
jgi:hypothetical protein